MHGSLMNTCVRGEVIAVRAERTVALLSDMCICRHAVSCSPLLDEGLRPQHLVTFIMRLDINSKCVARAWVVHL
jgi:hypothetical protein